MKNETRKLNIFSKRSSESGFIALMSAVIISALVIGYIFTTNRTSFNARFDVLDSEYKSISRDLAESCINQALLKLAQDYQYDPYGVSFPVGSGSCSITSITPHAPRSGNSTVVTITTKGSYQNTFSNFQTTATVANPSIASFVPLPSCYLWTNANSVTAGQSITLGWNSTNATSMKILATSNHAYDINSATPVASGSQAITLSASETFVGIATNSVGSTQCTTPGSYLVPSIIVQPPATCADTVMMLDRSGSMFFNSADIPAEKTAAKTLVNLYRDANPPGKLGVGRFGDLATGVSAEIMGLMNTVTTAYATTLSNLIDNGLPQNPISYTNLADAISVAGDPVTGELNNPARHDPSKAKVLILISDGEPNRPTGTKASSTALFSPTADSQNATGELWSNPINAYMNGAGDSSDPVSENDRHRFYNFNFPILPTGATIAGIEANIDAWNTTTTTTNSPANMTNSPSSTGTPSQWTNASQAYTSNDSYATNSTNGDQQVYSNFNFNIPTNATITGVQVSSEAKVASAAPVTTATLYPTSQGNYTLWTNGVSTIDETGTPNCSSSNEYISESNSNDRESVKIDLSSIPNDATITDINITAYDRGDTNSGGTYRTFTSVNTANYEATTTLSAGATNTCGAKTQNIDFPDLVKSNTTDIEIGVLKVAGNTNTVRVGALRATVTYIPQNSGSISIALSSQNGSSYTSAKSTTLSNAETVSSPTSNNGSDLWGRTWVPSDFNNGKFVLRVQNTTASGTMVSLDHVYVNVFYTIPTPVVTSCQIGMDLSWNAGSSWTTEKIQNLNETETTYTLGSSSDDWSSSHTWQNSELTNTNFRARVRAIDPGASCDNLSVDHLDWMQIKIHYTEPLDASISATTAADLAKGAGGVQIYTIHFGSTSSATGRNFLASLASGNSTNSVGTSTTQASKDLENNDLDNFFISPSSSDMAQIFKDIGIKVCPAATAPPVPPAPPTPPPPPPPPPNISVGSWVEI